MNKPYPDLPEYDPHPDLWNRIEADLVSDERLGQLMNSLPAFEPAPDLWARIEADVVDPEPLSGIGNGPVRQPDYRSRFTIVRSVWAGVAAAAVVILVGVWLLVQPATTGRERIEYAVETSTDWSTPAILPATDADRRAEEFIARQCAEQALACQRPEVHELRNQLTELTTEQQRLEAERQTFGDDPALVRAQVKIENQRAEVTKELISLLRS
ncbi:hypothetical protein [Spirosoma sp. 209]|uniref:hypothetical protein n=1 Tax=Spirosoma sp. 209 TaxID=1955701 RepID=UPI00098D6FFE|nr:hypothetical protein [Spirosoma sp. 209]